MKILSKFPVWCALAILAAGPVLAEEIGKPTPAPVLNESVDEPAVIDRVVYLAKLPTPDELIKGAEAKSTPILRMDQTADRIVVVYQYSNGRQRTFAYTLLSAAGSSRAPTPSSSQVIGEPVAIPTPAPAVTKTVVYTQPEVIYYESSPRYYRYRDSAWDFWAPFTVGVGLGWIGGHSHGHYHGYSSGWHGGYRGWRH